MNFIKLAELYSQLESISSGNKMREVISQFLATIPQDEINLICHLCIGNFGAQYEDKVLGIAEKTILKAIAKASGRSDKEIKEIANKKGDAGLVAEQVFKNKPFTLVPIGDLSIKEFDSKINKIISSSGKGSQDLKIKIIISMLQKCSSTEAKYLTRLLLNNMRIGVGDMTILDSLAIAFTGEKTNKKSLEKAYNIYPNVGVIAERLKSGGLEEVNKISIKVGTPIRVMLAQRVKDINQIKEKIPEEIAVETKYDGERVQVHKDINNKITLYSRRMENITYQFPDLVKYITEEVDAKDFILEGEIIPIAEDGSHLNFQTLMQRKRKTEIEKYVEKIPVKIYCFDLLYLNGKDMMQKLYPVRMKKLESIISGKNLKLTERIFTKDISVLDKFFNECISKGYEGIIVKSQEENSTYKAGARDWSWIKWKQDYITDAVDTLDLVVVGAFYGKGKRSGNYGSLLCATYNSEEDVFETISKLGTGMTDEILKQLPPLLETHKVDDKPARVIANKDMYPDVWFEPSVVVEVLATEVTRGNLHTCSQINGKGLALRFPRFIQIRENKSSEQATTSREVEEIFNN